MRSIPESTPVADRLRVDACMMMQDATKAEKSPCLCGVPANMRSSFRLFTPSVVVVKGSYHKICVSPRGIGFFLILPLSHASRDRQEADERRLLTCAGRTGNLLGIF